jgi:hypothetical protein
MKKLSKQLIIKTGFFICALLFIGCNETNTEKTNAEVQETPMLEAAPQEYSDLVQKSLDLLTEFDLETWSELLADDVAWYWPDGNSETRNSIKGKDELIAWWKNWKETTGGQLTFANNTFLPIQVNKPSNYYKVVGTGVITYTDLTISIGDKSTSVRQNMVYMFNDAKKMTHVFLYYDRTGIVELTNVVLGETE